MKRDENPTTRTAYISAVQSHIAMVEYFFLVAIGVASRLLPHPPNVTAIAALGLLAGARGESRREWIVPVIALLLTDLWLGGYEPISMLFVYGGFAAGAAIGRCLLRGRTESMRTAAASVLMSSTFFVISNFGWWLSGVDYPNTLAGLMGCYVAALPWFGASLVGDLCYSLLLIGTYDRITGAASRVPIPTWGKSRILGGGAPRTG